MEGVREQLGGDVREQTFGAYLVLPDTDRREGAAMYSVRLSDEDEFVFYAVGMKNANNPSAALDGACFESVTLSKEIQKVGFKKMAYVDDEGLLKTLPYNNNATAMSCGGNIHGPMLVEFRFKKPSRVTPARAAKKVAPKTSARVAKTVPPKKSVRAEKTAPPKTRAPRRGVSKK